MTKPNQKFNIVCIGGGTGTFVVLKGLKQFPYDLHAIVTMSDSGGSNKRIRDEFGLLPTSDVRQCLVALSDENGGAGLLRKLFMYRFDKGAGLSGMTFGNLFMAALSDILGSQEEAIRQTGKVLRIQGTVIPVTFTDSDLYADYEDGSVVNEEHLIDEPQHDGKLKITNVYLKPAAQANPEAISAIQNADLIILGPGDLYTSLIPNLLVAGIKEAIISAKGKKVYIMNLMTKYGQTYGFSATNHIQILEKYIAKSLNYVIINTAKLDETALKIYQKENEIPVLNDLAPHDYYRVVGDEVVGNQLVTKDKSDSLIRSLIRHDSAKLAQLLNKILENKV
jgi:uncharacterized cofD-like protein